jgi:hypothetical protein
MPPNLDVLPVKASQDAKVKRKLVYLDQMIVTNVAKAKLGRELPAELRKPTSRLRDALKVAVREKQNARLVESHFHRDESSGIVNGRPRDPDARALFDEIASFVQYYSFGLQISYGIELIEVQAVSVVAQQLGFELPPREYRWRAVLSCDPQGANEEARVFKIGDALVVIGLEWQPRILEEDRTWAADVTRMRENGEFPSYESALARAEREWRATAIHDNQWNSWAIRYGSSHRMPRAALDELIASERLFSVPYLFMNTRLYAHVLSESTRRYKNNDLSDMRILSSIIPYCDLVITDRYMADAATRRGLDAAFHTKVLAATPDGINEAAEYLLR